MPPQVGEPSRRAIPRIQLRTELRSGNFEEEREMNTKAAALTGAILWGGAVLLVGAINLKRAGYGREFLRLVSSIYPGYSGGRSGKQVVIATLYAALDGGVGGAITAAVYNKISAASAAEKRLRAA